MELDPHVSLEENRYLGFEVDMMLEEIETILKRNPFSPPESLITDCERRLEQHFYFEEYMMRKYSFDEEKIEEHVNDHMNLLKAVNSLRSEFGFDLISIVRSAYEIHKRLYDASFSDELERRMGL